MCYRSEDNNLMKYKTALVKRAIAEMNRNDDGVDPHSNSFSFP